MTVPPVFGLALRPARASYRFISAAAVLLVALTACSSDDPAPSSNSADSPDTTATFPEISGEVGQIPTVEFSEDPDVESVETLVVTSGSEGTVASDDLVASHQVIYEWGPDGQVSKTYSSYEDAPLLISVSDLAEAAPEAAVRAGRASGPGAGVGAPKDPNTGL